MGMILGTAAYMSPGTGARQGGRQARRHLGAWLPALRNADRTAGVRGRDVTETITALMRDEPDWTLLPSTTPPAFERLLVRCLERDPRKRLRDIGDARADLDQPVAVRADAFPSGAVRGRRFLVPVALPAAAAVLIATGWLAWSRPAVIPPAGVMSANLSFPRDVEPVPALASGFGVSPDGRRVFIIGMKDGRRRLFLRSLDNMDVTEFSDPSGVNGAAFSPDGNSLALIIGGGDVIRLSLADRQRTVATTTADISGGIAWGDAGILFSRNGALWIAPADGGAPRALTTIDAARHEVLHDSPLMLPGGRIVLFSSLTTDPGTDRIESVTVASGARAVVLDRATTPLLVRRDTSSSHGTAPSSPFRSIPRQRPCAARPSRHASGGRRDQRDRQHDDAGIGVGNARHGTAWYSAKQVWSVGRDGSALVLDLPGGRYANPRVSPDGRRLLVESYGTDMSVFDFARGTLERLSPAAPGPTSVPGVPAGTA